MPVFKFPFKSLSVYRLLPEFRGITESVVREAVQAQRFQEDENGPVSEVGWAGARDNTQDPVFFQDRQVLLRYRRAKKVLPSSVVNEEVRRRALKIEQEQGYKPGRKQRKEIKENVIMELLPKSHTVLTDTLVWMDLRNGWLVLDSTSSTRCDDVLGLMAKTFEPFPATPLRVNKSPAGAMTDWLFEDMPPSGFSIDQETELRSTGESRALVRYVRETPDHADVARQVGAGKQCVRLAMTWADRISFVLTDDLRIKRLTPLDIVAARHNEEPSADDDAQFHSTMALFTGECAKLIGDVVAALGGESTELDGNT
ncbi:recombination-associated protein RdgC [Allopusillimonas ginsengisoli]|uniref:recombination-associated protein RdgC n=1 Tax=Allopusillimonas ginsengisoli TaxID=453575 RepID=UPI0039C3BCC2